jgi:uncharacterized repeat protein (TIGR01451 family)
MINRTLKLVIAAALFAGGFATQASAESQGCITVKTTAEVEKDVVNDKGQKTKVLVPAGKVIPGTEVVWTVTANNACNQPSQNVTINNPVPEHMTLVPNSAIGPGSTVTYSTDGKTFAAADQLKVQENGVTRQARAEELKYIRWELKSSLQPGASAFGRFRAVLN